MITVHGTGVCPYWFDEFEVVYGFCDELIDAFAEQDPDGFCTVGLYSIGPEPYLLWLNPDVID